MPRCPDEAGEIRIGWQIRSASGRTGKVPGKADGASLQALVPQPFLAEPGVLRA